MAESSVKRDRRAVGAVQRSLRRSAGARPRVRIRTRQ
ncbi:Uncharacterised protein [Elizabethkingia miricola]|nr:Uncharacterised protein [Elizabethkingia miricola]DAT28636.1 MAG TPA: hypothetical protein [Caudoviricetes sp.]